MRLAFFLCVCGAKMCFPSSPSILNPVAREHVDKPQNKREGEDWHKRRPRSENGVVDTSREFDMARSEARRISFPPPPENYTPRQSPPMFLCFSISAPNNFETHDGSRGR